ncbi:MAG: phosphate ABC transporter permease PstA [Salinirussus sp.]
MSEERIDGYASQRTLVTEESDYYDLALDTTIAMAVVSFLLGLLALVKVVALDTSGGELGTVMLALLAAGVGGVGLAGLFSYLGVVPITSQRVRGVGLGLLISLVALAVVSFPTNVSLATLFGLILLGQATVVGTAGAVSRLGLVDTEPGASAGLLAGSSFGVIGFLIGFALGATFLGSGLSLPAGVVAGVGMFGFVVLAREDLASTAPTALLLGVLGLTVVTAMIAPGWQWNPEEIQGGLTGGVVIPMFVLLGSVVGGWAAGKCRAGFGARGRQYGAFLVIALNALLMVVVMVSIVLFVTAQGLVYAFHGFQIGALSALVLLSPALVVAVNYARKPAGTDDWHSGARQFVRVLPLAVLGALGAFLLSVLVTGDAVEIPFTYDVLQNRELVPVESAFRIVPEPSVGTLVLVIPSGVLFAYFLRRYGSLSQVGTRLNRQAAVQRGIGLSAGGIILLTVLFAALGPTPSGLPLAGTLGLSVVVATALATVGLVGAALAGLLVGADGLPERAHDRAQVVKIGLFGGLGLLATVTFLQQTALVNPSVGPVNLVPAVATLGVVVGLAVAVVAAAARRSMAAEAATERLRYRVIGEETTLGLVAAAGFLTIVGLHVAATSTSYTLLGVTVSDAATLSWPMIMEPYIPLGKQPGGILPAVVGTVWLVVGASSFAVPLGVGAAVFLTEYAEQGRFTLVVETATNALWSTPSIVFGLFGYAFLLPRVSGGDQSLLAGMLVLGFMLLPLVLITSREAIKSVPDAYRDASAALGVTKWQTIRSVVLPAAIPGIITGTILGIGRIAGETAPLLLVMGSQLNALEPTRLFVFTASPPFVAIRLQSGLLASSTALPTQIWAIISHGVAGPVKKGWGTAFVLLALVLTFYAIGITGRIYFRRKLNE